MSDPASVADVKRKMDVAVCALNELSRAWPELTGVCKWTAYLILQDRARLSEEPLPLDEPPLTRNDPAGAGPKRSRVKADGS